MRYHSMAIKNSFKSSSNSQDKFLIYDEASNKQNKECPFFCYGQK